MPHETKKLKEILCEVEDSLGVSLIFRGPSTQYDAFTIEKSNSHDSFYTMLAVIAFMCLQRSGSQMQWFCMKEHDSDQITTLSPECIFQTHRLDGTNVSYY